MSKKNKEKDESTNIVLSNNDNNEDKILLNDFVQLYKQTSGEHNSYAAGFRVWMNMQDKSSVSLRLTNDDWIKKFEEYLSSPVIK